MSRSTLSSGRTGFRLCGGLGVLVLGLVPFWLAGAWPQPAPRDGDRPPEKEDPVPRKNKKIQDPDAETPAPAPAPPSAPPASGLAAATLDARHPAVRALYKSLATPHDLLVLDVSRDRQRLVQPVPERIVGRLHAALPVVFLEKDGQPGTHANIQPHTFLSLEPYELLAQKAVVEFLGRGLHQLSEADPRYLSRHDQLVAAEVVLSAVLRFHESARQSKQRKGDGWAQIERGEDGKGGLRRQLLDVRLQQLTDLVEGKHWDQAFALGQSLTDTYPLLEDQEHIARPLGELLRRALRDPLASSARMREVRQHLRGLQEKYAYSETFRSLTKELKEQAEELFALAKEAETKEDNARMQDLLLQAEETWPQLPGLRAYRLKAFEKSPILRVGVRDLPTWMSPALACTDTERRVVEMLFESLVKCSPDANGLLHYQPGLALGRPQVVPLGRQFQLPRNAFWSNDVLVTAVDVRSSVEVLKTGGLGRAPAWGDLLEQVRAPDPFQIKVRLTQGYLEPLSLMTFKLLPQSVEPNADFDAQKAFAAKPVGSGPFRFDSLVSNEGQPYVRFVANLNYGSRPGKTALPRIKEIRFYRYDDPVEALRGPKKLHLLLDLTPEQWASVKAEAAGLRVTLPPPSPVNRRVYFLAVNHRNPLLKHPALRRALAHAINREAILKDSFRVPEQGKEFHKALNGPFPAQSWAVNPDPRQHNRQDPDSLDLHDTRLARVSLEEFHQKTRGGPIKLTLKYPSGSETVRKAMAAIQKDVQGLKDVHLELVERPPHELSREVEGPGHDFDLAYYHYDFPDETYWLWPLLGQRGQPAGNYLGYQNTDVEARLLELRGVRKFEDVREKLRQLYTEFLLPDMPLVPLWQLDPLLAYHNSLTPVPFDPWLVFTDVEQWRLKAD